MTATPLDHNLDAQVNSELEYEALIRSLKYTQGFGLLFVQCSPAEGERLIAKVRTDLWQKHIEVLSLTEPIETLYDKVEALYRSKPIDVLFVQGIEHSLYDYEKNRLWSDEAQRRSYSETGIPRLLQHLNLSRERFYEDFAFHFVFLVPHFVLKYLTRRAPDFFDWHSGVLEFTMDRELVRQESEEAIFARILTDRPLEVTPEDCRKNVLKIQALLEEPYQSKEQQIDLLIEQARLFDLTGNWEAVIACYDKALKLSPENDLFWHNRGCFLYDLGYYEKAIASYEKALQLKPDDDSAWYGRGISLHDLGNYEEAIASYDKALQFKPDNDSAWYDRGVVLGSLGRYEEAIASYDKVLQLKPDDDTAWCNRGIALSGLGRYKEAIASYDKALQLKPDDDTAWCNRGIALGNLGCYEEAIASYDKALQLKPDDDTAWYHRGNALSDFGCYEEAIANYDKALQLKPDDTTAWYKRGIALGNLGRYEEAITSYNKALLFKPDDDTTWYKHGIALGNLGHYEEAITSYNKALQLNPDNYGAWQNRGIALNKLGRH
jgi:tetratricopeptide (TPR) repeat protein